MFSELRRVCSSNSIFSFRILIEISLSLISDSSCTIFVLAASSSRLRKSILDFSGLICFAFVFLLLFIAAEGWLGLNGLSEALEEEMIAGSTEEVLAGGGGNA